MTSSGFMRLIGAAPGFLDGRNIDRGVGEAAVSSASARGEPHSAAHPPQLWKLGTDPNFRSTVVNVRPPLCPRRCRFAAALIEVHRRAGVASKRGGGGMEIFVQQLINGITLGSIYGLIAIGYTMVFGIIGMVNFAHGDVFMVSSFIGLIALLLLTTWLGIGSIALALVIVLVVAMILTSLVNWTIERVAYRPLRGSFRLAPLISAIGMSIFLSNFVQVAQGPRNKSIPPMFNEVITLISGRGYDVTVSYKQLAIWLVTAVLLAAF